MRYLAVLALLMHLLDLTSQASTGTDQEPTIFRQLKSRDEEARMLADALRRRACPVPCGYSRQLCCNANEICYTDPSNEAQCSATASPFPPSQTTVSVETTLTNEATVTAVSVQPGSTITHVISYETTSDVTRVSTYQTTQEITKPPSTATLTDISTYETTQQITQNFTKQVTQQATHAPSTATLTEITVSTYKPSSSPSSAPDSPESGNHTSTLPGFTQARPSWPTWKKTVVGVFSGVGSAVILAFLVWLLYSSWRKRKNRKEDRTNQQHFNEMEEGGTFRQVNTARIQEPSAKSLHRSASAAHYHPPAPRVQRRDRSPDVYAFTEEDAPPAWPPSEPPSYPSSSVGGERSQTPNYAYTPIAGPSDYERRSRSAPLHRRDRDGPYDAVPVPHAVPRRSHPILRRPAPPRPPTVEEYDELL